MLGVGADVEVPCDKDGTPYERWQSNDAKDQVQAIRESGKTPVKAPAVEQVTAMAKAVLEHEQASWLLDPTAGAAEQSAWWRDGESGVRLRARLDWVTTLKDGRLAVVDFKTTDRRNGAHPSVFAKRVAEFRYYMQEAWYRAAVEACTGQPAAETPFLFIVQEVSPPYAVNVIDLDDVFREAGADAMRHTVSTYAECAGSGVWPAYPSVISTAVAPRWM